MFAGRRQSVVEMGLCVNSDRSSQCACSAIQTCSSATITIPVTSKHWKNAGCCAWCMSPEVRDACALAAVWMCDSIPSGVPHHESKLEYLKVGCVHPWPVSPTVLSFTACVFQIPCITDQQDKDPLCAAADVLLLALILLCYTACSTLTRPSSSSLKSGARSCLHCHGAAAHARGLSG